MKKIKVTNEDIIENLQYLKSHIVENEKKTLTRASAKISLNIEALVERFTGYHYDYSLVNGHNLQFVAKNTLDKNIFKALNHRHYEILEQRINKEMILWIDLQRKEELTA